MAEEVWAHISGTSTANSLFQSVFPGRLSGQRARPCSERIPLLGDKALHLLTTQKLSSHCPFTEFNSFIESLNEMDH